jgi:hypothetical protein
MVDKVYEKAFWKKQKRVNLVSLCESVANGG